MKIYHISRKQILNTSIKEAWDFFSSPENLLKITPVHMGFRMLYKSRDKMYAGQIICYSINVLPLYTSNWTTEITHVSELHYFVDEQRFGPYALWHHQHHFSEVDGGIEMKDEINYAIPYGFIGRVANWLFVEKQLNNIFDYRATSIEKFFKNQKS